MRDLQARPGAGPPGGRAAVVFIGDGESDRYAAGYSDIVFAKRSLVRICLEAGWPFQRWTEFREIDALAGGDAGSLAGGSGVAAADRARCAAAERLLLRPRGLGRTCRPARRLLAAGALAPLRETPGPRHRRHIGVQEGVARDAQAGRSGSARGRRGGLRIRPAAQ